MLRKTLALAAVSALMFACAETSQPPPSTPAAPSSAPPETGTASSPTPGSQGTPAVPALSSTALPTRVAVAGNRFERVDAAAAGIDFVHQFSDDPARQAEFAGPFVGGGVALGDYDGDGRPDLYLTRPRGGGRLYHNEGDFKFRDATTEAGLADDGWTTGPAFVDVDGDGDLDLFVGRFDAPNRLYVNDGGRFTEKSQASGLDYSGATISMAFADVDRDGDLDGYLTTYRRSPPQPLQGNAVMENGVPVPPPEHREYVAVLIRPDKGPVVVNAGQRDRFFRNDGGRFVDASDAFGLGAEYEMTLSARFFDYDDDGFPDLYVANDFFGADHLYRNDGGRRFVEVTRDALPQTTWFSMGADAADIDGDGRLDLFTADMSGTTHFKQKLSMGDMTDDGWFLEAPIPRQYMRNQVFLNTGLGRFIEVAHLLGLANSDWTWTPKFGDLDEDGLEDLYISNGMSRDFSNSDIRQKLKTKGQWQQIDLDTWKAEPQRKEPNLAFRNEGTLHFASVGPAWGLDEPSVSFGAVEGDLDGDGDLDIVTNDYEAAPRIYRNRTADTHRVRVRLVGADGNTRAIGARVTLETKAGQQMRELSLSGGFMSQHEPVLHFGLGEQTQVDRLTVRWPSGREERFEKLGADLLYTINESKAAPQAAPPPAVEPLFAALPLPPGRHVDTLFDDFKRQPLLPNKASDRGPGLAWGDIDGDQDADLWQGGGAGQPGRILLREGAQLVQRQDPALVADAAHEDMGGLFFDADGDGDQDLYVVSGGVEDEPGAEYFQHRLYRNDAGTLVRAELPALRDSGGPVSAADFDADGDLDLFVGGRVVPGKYPTTPDSHLLRNDAGRFSDVTDAVAPGLRKAGMASAALWADVDADGRQDLLVAYEWGPVRLYRNTGGKLVDATQEAGLDARHGWWNGLAAADLDADGDVDLVSTNFGKNLKYKADDEHPAVLFYGPFGTAGEMQVVEAKYNQATLLPVRGLSCSSDAMPEIRQRFKTFTAFAQATLTDIYGETLDRAQRFEIDTRESGVWLNQGGRFTFKALPAEAQAAPAFGVGVLDTDADGRLDLVLAQKYFGPQRETGRMDGGLGLVLLGQADGSFKAAHPTRAGLLVPEASTALTVADLDGDARPDLAIATNDGPLRLYRSSAGGEGKTYSVSLVGPKGNPTGVGARVELVLAGGATRVDWVRAGGGYLSQEDGVARFGLGKDQKPEKIRVTWPDGQKTEVDATGDRATVKRG